MATIKVKFRPSKVNPHDGTIFYQVIHDRRVRTISSDYHIDPSEWDETRSTVSVSPDSKRFHYVRYVRQHIFNDLERFSRIATRLRASGMTFTVDDIVNEYRRYGCEFTLFNFMKSVIDHLLQNGKVRTAETYKATLNSFRHFRAYQDIKLDCISAEVMEEYETWLREKGLTSNTVSFYARILRAVYNRAVDRDIIVNRRPFRHVYTGIGKTIKRAVGLPIISRIKTYDLSGFPALDFARDMFIMSFCLRGMSFVDMSFLRKSDLRGGYLTYKRRKTGQQLKIQWTNSMQRILDKYPDNKSGYLLPIIRTASLDPRAAYRNMNYAINRSLKKLSKMMQLPTPLTLYVARHSWASAARDKGVPLSVISEGMGHDSEMTTRIYLASLDTSLVDRANSLILSSI